MLEENLLKAQARVRSRIQELVVPLFIFIISAFGVLIYGVWQSAEIQNRIEIGNTEKLFAALIDDQKQHLTNQIYDVTFRDSALQNLVIKLNAAWADKNMGTYLLSLHGLSGSYVVSDANKTIYAALASPSDNTEILEVFPNIDKIFRNVRLNFTPKNKQSVVSFLEKSVSGDLYLLAAAVFQADGGELETELGENATERRYLLVMTQKVDAKFFGEISARFDFPPIRLLDALPENLEEIATYKFELASSLLPKWAVWQPILSSSELVINVIKSTSIILICLFLLMVYIGVRAFRLNKVIDGGIRDYLNEKKILQQYEKAISDLGQGPTLFDLNVNEAFSKISNYAVSTLGIEEIGLWEFDVETRYMANVFCYDKLAPSSKAGRTFELDAYPELDQLFDDGFPFYTENIQEESSLANVAKIWFEVDEEVALLVIPVHRYGAARGFVHFAVRAKPFIWTEEKVRFACSLVDFVSLNFDIQDQKKIESQLRIAKTAAEKANASKTDFMSNMSHELRTPLNAIIGFSDLIKQGIFGPLGAPQYQEYVDDINMSARHLLGLINEILEISKTESGKFRIYPTEINLKMEIDTCSKLLEGRFQDKKYELDIRISDDLDIVKADPNAFRKILLNLMTNAVKFTVDDAKVRLEINRSGSNFEIQISDNGIGISPSDLEKIFDPFTQAENSANKRFEGTGLGLSITKSLIEMHGGSIVIDSIVGEGTTVRATLPITPIDDILRQNLENRAENSSI